MATTTTASSVFQNFDQYQYQDDAPLKDNNINAGTPSSPTTKNDKETGIFIPKFQSSTKNNPHNQLVLLALFEELIRLRYSQ
jgi:hypothetical protein